jgi:mRNA interferase RelE/StbE
VANRKPRTPKIRIPEQVAELIRKCHPELKRKIRSALERIQANPQAGKQLRDELTGLRSYRVSRFRIIYRSSSRNTIDIIAIGPRRIIYEETYRLIKKDHRNLIG